MATDYYGLGEDYATPADLVNSDYSGYTYSGTPDYSLNTTVTPTQSNYTYATPDELAANVQYGQSPNAINSGIGYATPAELAANIQYGQSPNTTMSGQGATGSYAPSSSDYAPSSSGLSNIIANLKAAGSSALQNAASKTATVGGLGQLATSLAAIYGALNPSFRTPQSTGGYDKAVPHLTAMRTQLAQAPYKAYSGSSQPVMGRNFFTPTVYAAEGGLMGMAAGGHAQAPHYLAGPTDGMADKLNTSIDGTQPAKLSHGEFVIPADVVSHLGNGNSTAGADVLYKMMERVRKARTGNPKQGKEIDPQKFTPGGITGYAEGGVIGFNGTDPVFGSAVPQVTSSTPQGASNSSTLSSWAGPYVTDMLGKGQALTNAPTPVYQGPLTAGTSPLQQQAFNTASNLPTTYNATQFNSGLGPVGSVQSYMNPYMQGAVDVQNTEARRQAGISRVADAARLTQAGAYGGGRQAIMESEGNRNLAQLQNNNQLTGLNTAYDKAVQQQQAAAQMNMTGQQNTEASKQFGAGYGLSSLGAQETAGAQQRGIEQQGIDALHAQFEEQKADPYKEVQFQQSLLSGLPISTSTTTPNTSGASNFQDLLTNLGSIFGSTPAKVPA